MMFRRKKNERQFKIDNLGALIIERVQSPHSLHEQDGSVYEIMTWTFSLRFEDGPVVMERIYTMGEPEAIEKMSRFVRGDIIVNSEMQARYMFYNELWKFFGSK